MEDLVFKKLSEDLEEKLKGKDEDIETLRKIIKSLPSMNLLVREDITNHQRILRIILNLFGFDYINYYKDRSELNKLLDELIFNGCRKDVLRNLNQGINLKPDKTIKYWEKNFPKLNWIEFKLKQK